MEEKTSSPKPLLSELPDEEVHRRVRGLIALGNSPKVTELILLQAGAMPEQVKEALDRLQQEKQAEGKEQNFLGWVVVLVSILLVLLGLYLWQNWPGGNQKAAEQSSSSSGNLLDAALESFLEKQDLPPLNNLPEPSVEYDETGKAAACPQTSEEAASLYGGKTGTWLYQTDIDGWLFYDNAPSQLRIPENMSGSLAHGSARSPKFLPVIGPVKASNVYIAYILCP